MERCATYRYGKALCSVTCNETCLTQISKILLNTKSIATASPSAGQIELWDTLVPGFGIRIAAGGARTFFVMRRVNGKLVRRTVGRAFLGEGPTVDCEFKLPQARERARDMLTQLRRGIDTAASTKASSITNENGVLTFKAVSEGYFADSGKQGGGSLKSRAELERKVRVDLREWHSIPVADITRADVRALLKVSRVRHPHQLIGS